MPVLNNTILQVFTIGLISLLVGCGKQADTQTEGKQLIRPVKVAIVSSTNGNNIKTFPATVEPTQIAHLTFRVNGEIEKLHVVAGQHVEKGQLLASLDDKDFSLQLKQAQARYDLTKSQFGRSKKLFKEQLISSSAFDEAKAQLDIVEAQLNVAQTNLKYTSVRAPFDGIVAQLNIEQFEFIQAKQPIMELQGRKQVDIAIEVSESVMAKLPKSADNQVYQPTLILDTNPNRKFKVTLKEHDITPNPVTKSYKVVFSMDIPSDINVLAGMTGDLIVEMDQVLELTTAYFNVPVEAIFLPNQFAGTNKSFVYKLSAENKTVLTEVEMIKISNESATIRPVNDDELFVGDLIVATGSHLITNDLLVKPWAREKGL